MLDFSVNSLLSKGSVDFERSVFLVKVVELSVDKDGNKHFTRKKTSQTH